ncbi:MAG: TonB-dependent receptor [Dyadobacter sp.]|uniref:TonB-dependent receptor n=1 Tax=Dyadobacter sp. TaxID=1914288 RepID=UPI001B2E0512|nr:TonB-dependent receptor [Dyadobacter sp.]MBO9616860.1 TonB-dependent receptor [Dyadobacter sp.]
MKFLSVFAVLITTSALGQSMLRARVVDAQSLAPLPGATVQIIKLNRGATADESGLAVMTDIPDGSFQVTTRLMGYKTALNELTFPMSTNDTIRIALSTAGEELGEVTVSATRSSRTISDIPTRIEVISAGELDEKASMQPSNIRMALSESTGIQTQQTSPTSANATIRIQGLDGRYTQLLQDGFPLYSGFASGLSILQIPPLNLKRIELVKGSSSTLYGGGAIAGLINLVTKEPSTERELSFLANINQTGALDVSSFYSEKYGKTGLTLYASRNSQAAYDVNKDGFSDLPHYTRYTVNPKWFWYLNASTKISFGINGSFEDRLGGDMQVIKDQADSTHQYYEGNKTNRLSTQLRFDKTLANKDILSLKNGIGYFARDLTRPDYYFGGHQVATFSELSYSRPDPVFEWVLGANLWTDQFHQRNPGKLPLDYSLNTAGVFAQSNWKPSARFVLESGLRIDYLSRGRVFALPRISALYKISPAVTMRATSGMGYKAPTIFTEEAEEQAFRAIQPINTTAIRNEASLGGSIDINYRTQLSEQINLSVNQLFFYTRLNHALLLADSPSADGLYHFYNAAGRLVSRGMETNAKLSYDDLSLYLGYTFIDAKTNYSPVAGNPDVRQNPFTSRNRLYTTVLYEIDEKLRVGYELFYVGNQTIRDGSKKPSYWMMGISAERRWKHFSLFVNFENFLDARQSHFEPMYTGTIPNPHFADIWAPTDGFVYNGGFKLIL